MGFSSFVEVDVLLLEDPLRNFTIDFCTQVATQSSDRFPQSEYNQVGVESEGRCQ